MFSSNAMAGVVLLRNGSRIEAPLLQHDAQSTVVDLGYKVAAIPAGDILSVDDRSSDSKSATATNTYYSTEKPPQLSSPEDTVAACGGAVVLVKSSHDLGSGFFINKKGYLVTDNNIVKGDQHLTVIRFKKENGELKRIVYHDIDVVSEAAFHGVAVLKVNGISDDLNTVVSLAESNSEKVNDEVFAIGHNNKKGYHVIKGVIRRTNMDYGDNLYDRVDISVGPDYSGGPIFNSSGQVIGFMNIEMRTVKGFGFMMPTHSIKYVLDRTSGFSFDLETMKSGYTYPKPPSRTQKNDKTSKDSSK